MTHFEYEEWPLIYSAVLDSAAFWWNRSENLDPDHQPEEWLEAKTHADRFTRLRDKVEAMACERFPTVETIN